MKNKKPSNKYTSHPKIRVNRTISQELFLDVMDELSESGDWDTLIDIINSLLRKTEPDHWLQGVLAGAYYGKGDFDLALQSINKAISICGGCPLTRWTCAQILFYNGEYVHALEVLNKLMCEPAREIHAGPCGSGSDCNLTLDRAEGVLNDSRFLTAACYQRLGYRCLYQYFLTVYKRYLAKGVGTCYAEENIEEMTGGEEL
ncbi:hypothetical protein WBG78_27305 [Chryseolinea sp. T2]|uniref:tetratricopeptide repeat protein n=1 Tax=Chryseolinea sp. T2 TaxID=3129255 RepID=UPI003077BAEA